MHIYTKHIDAHTRIASVQRAHQAHACVQAHPPEHDVQHILVQVAELYLSEVCILLLHVSDGNAPDLGEWQKAGASSVTKRRKFPKGGSLHCLFCARGQM